MKFRLGFLGAWALFVIALGAAASVCVAEIELVLELSRAGIAVLVSDCVVHSTLGLAIGLEDGFPTLLRSGRFCLCDRGTAFQYASSAVAGHRWSPPGWARGRPLNPSLC